MRAGAALQQPLRPPIMATALPTTMLMTTRTGTISCPRAPIPLRPLGPSPLTTTFLVTYGNRKGCRRRRRRRDLIPLMMNIFFEVYKLCLAKDDEYVLIKEQINK